MRIAIVVVLALVLLPGCIFQSGQDDLSYVCEKKSGSPAPAYTTDGIVLFTNVLDLNLTAEQSRHLLAAVAPTVITLAGAKHANFSATLSRAENGWRFAGVGRAQNGSVVDTYTLDITNDNGNVLVQPSRPLVGGTIQPPETLLAYAQAKVNASPDLQVALNRTPTLVATGWDPYIPACVTLLYQDGPADAVLPASPAHPHTTAVVSFSSGSIVFLKKDGWTG